MTDQTAIYDAIDAFQRTHRLPGLQHAQIRGLLAEHLARVLPAAPAAAPSAPADRAALRDRIRRAVCEAEGFAWDTDMLEPDEYGEVADTVLAVLPEPADDAAGVAEAIRSFPFDNFGMDDVSFALEDDPEAQEWVPALADAVLATLPATTARAVELRDYWHGEAMSATTRIIELEGQLEELRRMADEAQQTAPWLSDSARIGRTLIWTWADIGKGVYGQGYRAAQTEARALLTGQRDSVEAQQPETQAEDPARIDRIRPEFTEHASVESIDVQLRRARSQLRRWHLRVEWLISLRQARVMQKERGEWPAAVSQPGKEA